MVKLRIKTDQIGCRKPGCTRRLRATQRHHRRCETLFIRAFRPLKKSHLYIELCERYEQFLPEDTVVICNWHHAEIHAAYNRIISADSFRKGKPLESYSWKQANGLMKKLRNFCLDWEKRETPGLDPKLKWPTSKGEEDEQSIQRDLGPI